MIKILTIWKSSKDVKIYLYEILSYRLGKINILEIEIKKKILNIFLF